MTAEPWPDDIRVRVRVGMHTGEAEGGGGRLGPTANRAARIRALAEGGQVFLSHATAGVLAARLPDGFGLVDLGTHRLRGFDRPGERVRAVGAAVAGGAITCRVPVSRPPCVRAGGRAICSSAARKSSTTSSPASRRVGSWPSSGLPVAGSRLWSGPGSSRPRGAVSVAEVSSTALLTPGPDPVRALRVANLDDQADLLVVDQFEEVFTLCSGRVAAELGSSTSSCTDVGRRCVSLRADFYGHCAAHDALASRVSANNVLLGPMPRDELQRAIEGPAQAGGLRLEPGLVDSMLRDVEGEPGALPLLSHALYESWARRDGRALTLAGYRAAGGVRGAIAQTAEEVFVGCNRATSRRSCGGCSSG